MLQSLVGIGSVAVEPDETQSAASRRAAAASQDAGSVLPYAAALTFIAAGVPRGVNRKSNVARRGSCAASCGHD